MSGTRKCVLILAAAGGLAAVLAVTVWLVATAGSRAADAAYDDARNRWTAGKPAAYAFDYFACGGMCDGCSYRITVRDGVVVQIARPTDRRLYRPECDRKTVGPPWDQLDIDAIFESVDAVRSDDFVTSIEITYDPTRGFPSRVVGRCDDDVTDCGYSVSITHFVVP